MPPRLSTTILLNISKRNASTLKHVAFGIHLSTSAGMTLEKLVENAARDRMNLASEMLKAAKLALRPRPIYRVCLARSYYAMYHAARSVVFYVARGDDHESHSDLPKHFPKDFPDLQRWENELKNARFERNRADYDPYPKSDTAFSTSAQTIFNNAEAFLPIARGYLRRKGCTI